jgi:hypothetical protein
LTLSSNRLRRRSEEDNEHFLKSVHIPFFEFRRRDLDPEWLVAIPNEHLFLPDAVYWIRNSLKSVIYQLENVLINASKVLVSPDVETCAQALDTICQDTLVDEVSGELVLRADLWGPASGGQVLRDAITTHRRRIRKLKRARRWKDFLNANHVIAVEHTKFFEAHRTAATVKVNGGRKFSTAQAVTTVKLDPATLKVTSVATRLCESLPNASLPPFRLRAAAELWRYEHEFSGSGWRQLHRTHSMLMRDYYAYLFPAEHVGPTKLPLLAME